MQDILILQCLCTIWLNSDNHSYTSGSLWQFKRDEIEGDVDLTVDDNHVPNNLSSFKYKSSFITDRNGVKIAVPLKYLRSWEMPLINCKVGFSLKWYENFILSSAETPATFETTDTKLHVPVVTLKTKDNAKSSKLLSEGFKRSIYWNGYNASLKDHDENSDLRKRLDASIQGFHRLFVLTYARGDNITNENSYRIYFLPRPQVKNYNIEIDGRNFYDQSINDSIK